MNPRGCLVDLVSFLSSLAKEMPFLLSSRDACGKKSSIGLRLNSAPSITWHCFRMKVLHRALERTEGRLSEGHRLFYSTVKTKLALKSDCDLVIMKGK